MRDYEIPRNFRWNIGPQFREYGNDPAFMPLNMLGFGASYPHGTFSPVNLAPPQFRRLRVHAEPAVTGQSNHKPPLGVRAGVNNILDGLPLNERLAGFIRPYIARKVLKRIATPVDTFPNGCLEELFGNPGFPPGAAVGALGGHSMLKTATLTHCPLGACRIADLRCHGFRNVR